MRILWITLLLLGLSGVASMVLAHDFYEPWCCNGQDCKPYTKEVRETPEGYFLPDYNVTIPYKDANGTRDYAHNTGTRYSVPNDQGAQYHACILPSNPTVIRCFYAKPGGV